MTLTIPKIEHSDNKGNALVDGLRTNFYPEEGIPRDWYKPQVIEERGINGNPIKSQNPYIQGEIIIFEYNVPIERYLELEQFEELSNQGEMFRFTDDYGIVGLGYVAYVRGGSASGELLNEVEIKLNMIKRLV
jgi:hypothetical protein